MRQEQSQGISAHTDPPSGTLFLVGMPIGHPDDLTIRALATLRRVDVIATKDTRVTESLLSHHGIHIPLTTYNRTNAAEKTPVLLARLRRGQHIALVSDCGMPALYDPGRLLISAASTAGIAIDVIPGPSIVAAAATLCGMDANAFVFEGRCTGDTRGLARRLESFQREPRTLILLPPIHSLRNILTVILRTLGNRRIVLGLDLTHAGQNIVRGRARALLAQALRFKHASLAVLVVEGTRPGRKPGRNTT